MEAQAKLNTDRELWRGEDDEYAPRIIVTTGGQIGINVGGTTIVRDVREWHRLANDENNGWQQGRLSAPIAPEPDPQWEYTQYLQLLTHVQSVGVDVTDEIRDTVAKLHKLIIKA